MRGKNWNNFKRVRFFGNRNQSKLEQLKDQLQMTYKIKREHLQKQHGRRRSSQITTLRRIRDRLRQQLRGELSSGNESNRSEATLLRKVKNMQKAQLVFELRRRRDDQMFGVYFLEDLIQIKRISRMGHDEFEKRENVLLSMNEKKLKLDQNKVCYLILCTQHWGFKEFAKFVILNKNIYFCSSE